MRNSHYYVKNKIIDVHAAEIIGAEIDVIKDDSFSWVRNTLWFHYITAGNGKLRSGADLKFAFDVG